MEKQKVQAVMADVDAALKAIAQKHGLELPPNRVTYDFEGLSFRVQMKDLEGGRAHLEQEAFIRFGIRIDASKVGPEGETLVDIKTRSQVPFVLRKGKDFYRCNAQRAKQLFGVVA